MLWKIPKVELTSDGIDFSCFLRDRPNISIVCKIFINEINYSSKLSPGHKINIIINTLQIILFTDPQQSVDYTTVCMKQLVKRNLILIENIVPYGQDDNLLLQKFSLDVSTSDY